MKKFIDRLLTVSGVLAFAAVIAFIDYGLDTQCPNVADNVYIYCGKK